MNDDAPTLLEILQLTRQELTTVQITDAIRECGRAALSLLPSDPELCLKLAYQKLHDVPYKDVKPCWRMLYTDASLWQVVSLVEERETPGHEDWVDEVIRLLDMAIILTGTPGRDELVELWLSALKRILPSYDQAEAHPESAVLDRPTKRRKVSSSAEAANLPLSFATDLPKPAPILRHPLPRTTAPSLSAFQKKLGNIKTHSPVIIEGAIEHWPALGERPWNSPGYLMEQTLGGRRLVPVEIGKSYTDEAWGQRIITFQSFMSTYMLSAQTSNQNTSPEHDEKGEETPRASQTGYLAQHDLFAQIPSLRSDISIPDYCYTDPAPSPHLKHIKPVSKLEDPLLNAWFGPAGTVSPLHTDPYHNMLAQVVGYKYIRLYPPEETANLYPRGVDENGVDMSNTSQVDLDEAMSVMPELSCWENSHKDDGDELVGEDLLRRRQEFEKEFPRFRHARYVDCVLGPGECLYLPVGWWHYVGSLTTSFSVSFWFN